MSAGNDRLIRTGIDDRRQFVAVAALTLTTTSSAADSALSLAVRRRVYVPAIANVAVTFEEFALTNTTAPGPLTLLQVFVRVLPWASHHRWQFRREMLLMVM